MALQTQKFAIQREAPRGCAAFDPFIATTRTQSGAIDIHDGVGAREPRE